MPFVFLATQDAPRRHNEAAGSRHRSRVTNKKPDKTSPYHYHKDCQEEEEDYFPLSLPERDHQFPSGDVTIDEDTFYQDSTREETKISGGSFDLHQSQSIPSLNLNDDQLNELCNNNNNNDHFNNINNKLSETNSFGVPVQSFHPPLIKWPLDNNTKSKRIADIKQQVKLLSKAIKMTMDNDHAEAAAGKAKGISPFSHFVNMSLLQTKTEAPSAGAAASLPEIRDVQVLLESGRNKDAKHLIREANWAVNHCVRESLWKVLSQNITLERFSESYYWDTVQQIYGSKELSGCNPILPTFVDERQLVSHCLSDEGIKACNRVVAVVAFSFPGITYAPLTYSLAAIFTHFMDEPETYNCLTALINKGSSYIPQTKLLNESMWRTVLALARKHVKGSFLLLSKYGMTDEQINDGFKNWTRWIFNDLPMAHLVRVVDCFLLEGYKVLMRCSLALFHIFMKNCSRDASLAASLTTKGFSEAISLYCKSIDRPPTKLLKTSFGIRALSKSEIKKFLFQSEMMVKNQPELGSTSFQSDHRVEGLPTKESQDIIEMKSHTLGIKELLLIWNWLPLRMTMQHPTLIYTTEEHGSSIRTFFNKVDQYEPTLLIVRTTTDYVFGAYCSTAWSERMRNDEYGNRQTYFGTGETFLFSLRPKPAKYEWVGIIKQRENSELRSVSRREELYMHADEDGISIGGGQGQGLMLNHEFQSGKTEKCETFNNPPLCPEEHFQIKVVEVYGLSQN